mmetsp:Transcript_125541/g.313687  ORF Transcript_125541/g.313687 Transcript_125541/m.313687 type:complete len:204 (-) Transcript_125541:206-817(-)
MGGDQTKPSDKTYFPHAVAASALSTHQLSGFGKMRLGTASGSSALTRPCCRTSSLGQALYRSNGGLWTYELPSEKSNVQPIASSNLQNSNTENNSCATKTNSLLSHCTHFEVRRRPLTTTLHASAHAKGLGMPTASRAAAWSSRDIVPSVMCRIKCCRSTCCATSHSSRDICRPGLSIAWFCSGLWIAWFKASGAVVHSTFVV